MRTLGGRIARADGSIVEGVVHFGRRIEAVEPRASAGASDYILPSFIDLQVNGSHGLDVMTASAGALAEISRKLAREGTTGWFPTATTAPLDTIERVHASVAEAIAHEKAAAETSTGAAILGMHLEGPFISPLRLGAHPKLNLEPQGEALERVLALSELRLLTLAPELAGALEAIPRLAARAVVVSIGHTNATFAEAQNGIAAGARMFTHLFNAMRPLTHRDPGVVGAALTTTTAIPAVIPDGVHVAPEVLRIIYKARGAGGIILTTDRVSLAGAHVAAEAQAASGPVRFDALAARRPDGTLAGSVISMLDGVRVMVERAGVTVGEAAVMAATNPAAVMGLADRGRISPGTRADLLVISHELDLKAVFVVGREAG